MPQKALLAKEQESYRLPVTGFVARNIVVVYAPPVYGAIYNQDRKPSGVRSCYLEIDVVTRAPDALMSCQSRSDTLDYFIVSKPLP